MIGDIFDEITITHLLIAGGFTVFLCWLLNTRVGTEALADSKCRRTSISTALVVLMPFVWLFTASAAIAALDKLNLDISEAQRVLTETVAAAAVNVIFIVAIILLVRRRFARGN